HLAAGEGVGARSEGEPRPAAHPEDPPPLGSFPHEEDGGGLADPRRSRGPADSGAGCAHAWAIPCLRQVRPYDPHPRPHPRIDPPRRPRAPGDRRPLLPAAAVGAPDGLRRRGLPRRHPHPLRPRARRLPRLGADLRLDAPPPPAPPRRGTQPAARRAPARGPLARPRASALLPLLGVDPPRPLRPRPAVLARPPPTPRHAGGLPTS